MLPEGTGQTSSEVKSLSVCETLQTMKQNPCGQARPSSLYPSQLGGSRAAGHPAQPFEARENGEQTFPWEGVNKWG